MSVTTDYSLYLQHPGKFSELANKARHLQRRLAFDLPLKSQFGAFELEIIQKILDADQACSASGFEDRIIQQHLGDSLTQKADQVYLAIGHILLPKKRPAPVLPPRPPSNSVSSHSRSSTDQSTSSSPWSSDGSSIYTRSAGTSFTSDTSSSLTGSPCVSISGSPVTTRPPPPSPNPISIATADTGETGEERDAVNLPSLPALPPIPLEQGATSSVSSTVTPPPDQGKRKRTLKKAATFSSLPTRISDKVPALPCTEENHAYFVENLVRAPALEELPAEFCFSNTGFSLKVRSPISINENLPVWIT